MSGATPAGSGRWASDRLWLFDFREPLGPGRRCTATLRPDWKPARDAASPRVEPARLRARLAPRVSGPTEFSFSTGGPAVVSMQPGDGGEIEEDQHFLLRLNGAAVEATVAANAWCEVEGIGERLPLRIVGGDLREQVLKARRVDPAAAARTLLARCDRPLPHRAAVRVVWGKGIAAAADAQVITTIEQRFRFTVREPFTAEFSCERENANAACMPIRPMTRALHGAGAARAGGAGAPARRPPATRWQPVFDKDDRTQRVQRGAVPEAARRERGLHASSCRAT